MIKIKALLRNHKNVFFFIKRIIMKARIMRHGWKGVTTRSWVVAKQEYIASDLVLGDFGFIGKGCTIYPKVKIGRFLLMAPGVAIIGGDHAYDVVGMPICYSGRSNLSPTCIGDDVWIGMRAQLMTGIKVGAGAIVAANAVVTKDVPSFAIVAGVPAEIIGWRFQDVEDRKRHLSKISRVSGYLNILPPLE